MSYSDPDKQDYVSVSGARIAQAEYWNAPDTNVERLYGFAKAIATGDTKALGEHQKVRGPGN